MVKSETDLLLFFEVFFFGCLAFALWAFVYERFTPEKQGYTLTNAKQKVR